MTTNYSATELYQAWLEVMSKRNKWKKGFLKLKDGTDAQAMRRGCWGHREKTTVLSWACTVDSAQVFSLKTSKDVRLCAILFDFICDMTGNGIRDAQSLEQARDNMKSIDIVHRNSLEYPSRKPDFWHFSSLPEDVQRDILAHLDAQARAREENSKAIRPWNATLYSKAAGLQKAMVADGMVVDGADGTCHQNKWGKGLFNGKPGALNGHFWFAEGILPDDAVVMPKIQGENRPYELSWSYEFTEELPSPFAEEKRDQDKPFSAKNGVVVFDLHGVVVLLPLLAYLYILRMFPGVKFMAVADGKQLYEKPVAAVVDGEVKAIIMPLKDARYWNCDDAIERYRYSASVGKYLEAYDDIPTSSENEHAPCDAPAEEEESIPSQQFKIGERYEIEYTLEGKTTAGPATIAMVANEGGYLVFDLTDLSFPLDASCVKVVRRLDPGEDVEFRQVHAATVPANPLHAYPFQLHGESTFRDYYSGKPIDNQQYEGLVGVGRDSILMATWMEDGERAWGSIGASCPYLPTFCYTESSRSPSPVLRDAHLTLGRRWDAVEFQPLDSLAWQLGLPTSYDHRRAQWALKPIKEVAPIQEDFPDVPLTEAEQEAMAARARATVEHLVLQRAQWTTIDGVDVLQIPGSNYAAVPCTDRKDARRFTVFTVDEREEYCQLTRKEVYDWLYAVAKTEIEEAEEFLASYTAPARSPSPAACSSGCVATMAYPWTTRISPVIGSAWATTSARTCRPPPARTEKSNLPSALYSNPHALMERTKEARPCRITTHRRDSCSTPRSKKPWPLPATWTKTDPAVSATCAPDTWRRAASIARPWLTNNGYLSATCLTAISRSPWKPCPTTQQASGTRSWAARIASGAWTMMRQSRSSAGLKTSHSLRPWPSLR